MSREGSGGGAERLAGLSPEQKRQLLRSVMQKRKGSDDRERIPRRSGEGPLPLSFAQQRLWFVDRLEPGSPAYNMAGALRLRGALDVRTLRRCLDELARRHETLRTVFAERGGAPVQVVRPPAPVPLPVLDLGALPDPEREAGRLAGEEALRPFDLARGPLLRATLLRLGGDDHVLCFTLHHVVGDGWSMGVLTREVSALYGAFARGASSPLPELPVQYADYAVWQRERLGGEALRDEIGWWRATLAGAPPLLEVPTDRPRAAGLGPRAGRHEFLLSPGASRGLRELARGEGATLFMALLAGWQALLARYSGQDDVVVGSPVAGRSRRETEGLIGFFVNMLPLRADLSGDPTWTGLLARVRDAALGAFGHQELPFERLVEELGVERDPAHTPVFQATFSLAVAGADDEGLELGGVRPEPFGRGDAVAKFDLELAMADGGGALGGILGYRAALFDADTAARMAAHLAVLLEAMAADPGRRVSEAQLLRGAERAQVLEGWNAPAAARPPACIHHVFAAQAARAPDAPAVVFGDVALSYGELDARANRLAHLLRRRGVCPDARVALCLERGPEMVVGLLAILKAGGAYACLDPELPAPRLALLLRDLAAPLVLTGAALRGRLPADVETVLLDADGETAAGEPSTAPEVEVGPEHLCYVIYTSGSTGAPKGTEVPHRAVEGFFRGAEYARFDAGEVLLQHSSVSWDALTLELWPALLTGGRCVLYPGRSLDPEGLAREVERHGVTTLWLTAALFNLVVDTRPEMLGAVRQVMTGGEAVSAAHLRRARELHPRLRLVNGYGPSECTVFATCHVVGDKVGGGEVPIGRPVGDRRVYVLDAWGEPAPVGVPGELHVGGPAVARGYLGRPALTADRFVPDPFGAPGARLYRSGDRARWRRDGELEHLGRLDAQVKVRGFRVEPGEIEARLAQHPGVRAAGVAARDDAPGGRRLVAYWVGDEELSAEALRAHLSAALPEYMVPAAYVRLDRLPLTPHGKLDRRALPAPEGDASGAREFEAPAGATEAALARVWAEVLGVEAVGRRDHFFERGGHSLLAVQVVSRVRQALGVEVPLGELFARPTLADFAHAVEAAARAELPPIRPVERGGPLPLSFAQRRLWFLEQLGGAGRAYHVPTGLRLRGGLDRGALRRALDRVVARHEALRTVFRAVEGEPAQWIAPAAESRFPLAEHDLRGRPDAGAELRRLAAEEAGAPFDLERGPLVRGRLVRLAEDDHALLVTMHHVVADGWSMGVLTRELGALYAAFLRGGPDPLPPLPVQYADYAAWQRRLADGPVLEEQARYWERTLAGAPELLELPTDRPRPARQDFAGSFVPLELDEELAGGLRALSRRHGATLFHALLAGWAVVLGRLAGQDDVVVGTPTANRGRAEIEGLIGFFVNTLALRVELSGAPGVAELLERVRRRALEAQQNQDVPFEQVVERVRPARSLAHAPLFQAMLAWQNTPAGALELPGLALDSAGPAGEAGEAAAKFDLTLTLQEADGRIVGGVEYATALFERATVERWLGYLRNALAAMAGDEGRRADELPLLPETERARVLDEWNRTARPYPRGVCVHELFEAWARERPDAAALVWGAESLSYRELDARADGLARRLARLGVGPDARVAVLLERGVELVVALLAVLKAGGCYVPLDPGYPAGRLRLMLEDSGARVLLTRSELAAPAGGADVSVVRLDEADGDSADPTAEPVRGGADPESLAYIVYTSGSTGTPKGVMVAHRHVVQLVRETDYVRLGPGDRVAQASSASFDALTFEAWGALLNGATLVGIPREVLLSPPAFRRALRDERITTLYQTTALLNQLAVEVPDAFAPLREVLFGGQAADADSVRRLLRAGGPERLLHVYGPTETTAWCSWERVERVAEDAPTVPVGRPTGNQRIYLLDPALNPVPLGAAGEAYVGGDGVVRGYLDRPGLTAERFLPDPFAVEAGTRMYRTGDRLRWRADGRLEFVGRVDEQVKIRGFRIEPGEIEAALSAHGGVREARVLVREDAPGEKRLVAYYAAAEEVDAGALRAHLAERLPEYMVPAAYVRLERLPLTPNGKVDARALPAPDGVAFGSRAYAAPEGEVEEALAAIWAELLGVERVGRHDHFFESGGHSLLAVQVVSRVRRALGAEVALGELFARPTLADFARAVAGAERAELPPIEPADRGGRIPLSFAQQRLWFLEQMGAAGAAYHVPTSVRLRGDLDRAALRRALDRVVERHEALRTVFPVADGEPEQRILPAERSRFHLTEHDLADRPDAEAELARLAAEEAGAPFDLARGPLVRGRLVRMGEDDHALLVTMHHVVSDGWSMGVLTRELSALYAAFLRGGPDPLPPLPVQYADYAAWQRRLVGGALLEEQADFWRRTLRGAPERLELPTDRPRPERQDHAGAGIALQLDAELAAGLRALSRRRGTTLFMTLLAGWAAVLGRLSGQEDVVVGTPTANRGRQELEGLIGFFVNTLALRVDLAGAPSVAELLERVRARALEAQHNQDLPFEQVVEAVRPARSLAHSPLFQAMFAWQSAPRGGLELPGLVPGPVGAAPQAAVKFDLSLALHDSGDGIAGGLEYATALFEPATAERWLGYLARALAAMAEDEERRVDRLPLLSEAERRQVAEEWSAAGAGYPRDACVHRLFEAQAARTPDAPALVVGGESLAYGELDARADRLAHRLRGLGVGPEARVGICLERGVELAVALLAVLKAGGACVPLDPAQPDERLEHVLRDSGAAVLVAGASQRGRGPVRERLVVAPDDLPPAPQDGRGPRPESGAGPRGLAYVLYTSGSTGTPKGVMVEHGDLAAHVRAAGDRYGVTAEDRVLHFAAAVFDPSLEQLLVPLTRGAAVVMRPEARWSPAELARRVVEQGITVANLPTAYWRQAAAEWADAGPWPPHRLRLVIAGGERMAPEAAAAWRRGPLGGVRLLNAYGPTEATITATAHELPRDGARPGEGVPIGRPLPGRRACVLDAAGEPVPAGVAGELYLGGTGVARGYLGRPGRTAESFVPDAFGGEPGARLYRTGDRARWRAGGVLEYLGRADEQVKVRGFRVEPGEIEAHLARHPGVREAVVAVREDSPGETRLVAYYTGAEAVEPEALRARLAERLPEYMVPAAYVRLEALPLTPTGKLDRGALPAPERGAYATGGYEAPADATEAALAELWAEALGVERVGRRDNFFALGGHSLLAVRVAARARQALGAEVAPGDLFACPTPESLAARIRGAEGAPCGDRAIPVRPAGTESPLFLVHEGSGSTAYAQVLHPHLDAAVPVYALPDLPAVEGRPRSVEEMAARLARMIREVQPAGPYRVAGWSFGGVLAYATAARLLAEGGEVEMVGMMDSHLRAAPGDVLGDRALLLRMLRMEEGMEEIPPPALRELAAAAATLELDALVARCREQGLLPARVAPERVRGMQARLDANRRALAGFRPRPISAAVHLFPALESPHADPVPGWRALLPGESLRVEPVPGTHLSMIEPPNVAALGAALSRAIRRAAASGNGASPGS